MIQRLYEGLRYLAYPVRRNLVFFVFMFLLFRITRWFEDVSPDEDGLYFLELFFDLYVVCAVISLLPKRVRFWARIVVYILSYLIVVVEAFIVERFHLFYSPVTLQLFMETNPNEAGEFLNAYLWSKALWRVTWVYGLILLFNVLTAFALRPLLFLLRKHFRGVSTTLVAFNVFVPLMMAYSLHATANEKIKIWRFFMLKDTVQIERTDMRAFYSPFYRILFSLKHLQVSAIELETLRKNMRSLKVDSCSHHTPNIVLIIGESYNKHHSSVYGYSLPTTPWQCQLKANGSLVPFSDAITPWNVTSNAFKNFMSTHSTDQKGSWADGVLFPALFRRAGYKVAFLSSQFYKSPNLGIVDFNGSFFMNDAELDTMCFDHRNPFRAKYDRTLISKLSKYEPEKYNLVIFHGMGQHQEYKKRFPANYAKFTKEDYASRSDLNDEEKQIVADYDNATLYNDEVMVRVCSFFRKWDVIVVYMPDHGEEVYDELHTFGRDHNANIVPELARNEFEIPLEIWFSKSFRRNHPDVVRAVKNAKDRPFSSDDLPHLLLGLAGIHCSYYSPERDLLHDKYNGNRKRLLKDRIDYDVLMKPYYQKHKK